MAYVTNYKHDIFVSYAHVDDEPLPGADRGWVDTLVTCLKTRLAQKLGRSDAYSLWMDHELARHIEITPQIMGALRETAIMLIVMSPGYIASDWCQREKEAFLNLVKEKGGSRVFIVERDEVEKRPSEFSDLKGFRFWIRDPKSKAPRILGSPIVVSTEKEYYALVDELCYELTEELFRLKAKEEGSGVTTQATGTVADSIRSGQPTVYLAQVTDDLDPQRNNIKRYLNQVGINVLPTVWYSQEPNAFKKAALQDLEKCEMFVQLLSDAAGKKPPDLPQGYAKLQMELAETTGKPILQWRSPALDISTIEDKEHLALIHQSTVRAEGIEDFKREIRKRVLEKPEPPLRKHVDAFVFVDMETADRPLAEQVCEVLDRYGASYSLPIESGSPSEIRRDLDQNLEDCDGIIIIYGSSTATWVRRQLLECRKILHKRDRPLYGFGLFEGPPEQKDPLAMKMHNLHILNCRKGLDELELMKFLDRLKSETG